MVDDPLWEALLRLAECASEGKAVRPEPDRHVNERRLPDPSATKERGEKTPSSRPTGSMALGFGLDPSNEVVSALHIFDIGDSSFQLRFLPIKSQQGR